MLTVSGYYQEQVYRREGTSTGHGIIFERISKL
jgi:hypothetical protein